MTPPQLPLRNSGRSRHGGSEIVGNRGRVVRFAVRQDDDRHTSVGVLLRLRGEAAVVSDELDTVTSA